MKLTRKEIEGLMLLIGLTKDEEITEIICNVAVNLLTNYFNIVALTDI